MYRDYGGELFYPVPVCRPAPKDGFDGKTLVRKKKTGSPAADEMKLG